MQETVVQYWPKGMAIPEGWELVNSLESCHHGVYSVLIRQVASIEVRVAEQNIAASFVGENELRALGVGCRRKASAFVRLLYRFFNGAERRGA